jgi:hypothetical protein
MHQPDVPFTPVVEPIEIVGPHQADHLNDYLML